jgi:hypothetical protein
VKKGCFVKIIIVLTVLVAVILFLLQNYFDDLVLKPGEKFITGLMFDGLKREMEHVKETPEKDSLIALMDNFVHHKFKNKEQINLNGEKIEDLVDSVKTAFEDSVISREEIEKITELFENK